MHRLRGTVSDHLSPFSSSLEAVNFLLADDGTFGPEPAYVFASTSFLGKAAIPPMAPAATSIGWPGKPWKHAEIDVELKDEDGDKWEEGEVQEDEIFNSTSNRFHHTMRELEQESEEMLRSSQRSDKFDLFRKIERREENRRQLVGSRERNIHGRQSAEHQEGREDGSLAEGCPIIIPFTKDDKEHMQTRRPIISSVKVNSLTTRRAEDTKWEPGQTSDIVTTNTSRSVSFKRHSVNDTYLRQAHMWKEAQSREDAKERLEVLVHNTHRELFGSLPSQQKSRTTDAQRYDVLSSKLSLGKKNFKDLISLKQKRTKTDMKTIEGLRETAQEEKSEDEERIDTKKEKANIKQLKESSFTFYGNFPSWNEVKSELVWKVGMSGWRDEPGSSLVETVFKTLEGASLKLGKGFSQLDVKHIDNETLRSWFAYFQIFPSSLQLEQMVEDGKKYRKVVSVHCTASLSCQEDARKEMTVKELVNVVYNLVNDQWRSWLQLKFACMIEDHFDGFSHDVMMAELRACVRWKEIGGSGGDGSGGEEQDNKRVRSKEMYQTVKQDSSVKFLHSNIQLKGQDCQLPMINDRLKVQLGKLSRSRDDLDGAALIATLAPVRQAATSSGSQSARSLQRSEESTSQAGVELGRRSKSDMTVRQPAGSQSLDKIELLRPPHEIGDGSMLVDPVDVWKQLSSMGMKVMTEVKTVGHRFPCLMVPLLTQGEWSLLCQELSKRFNLSNVASWENFLAEVLVKLPSRRQHSTRLRQETRQKLLSHITASKVSSASFALTDSSNPLHKIIKDPSSILPLKALKRKVAMRMVNVLLATCFSSWSDNVAADKERREVERRAFETARQGKWKTKFMQAYKPQQR
ncbi:hypothetical protein GUITHDRAFT_139257 [Guillardia theta CCMP2712]|uniref:Uncharacterized protein n=1 Tax=Guillardia theta (strain CCMP2712) TaxID=905079 RepID=L1J8U2_GUITC|nr:hypothetical protein GUITHDRAFT_139257 [Guillardia theta CCMP2712]EKX44968.1 hypothetical protein GUITHDRAFT_139257 [Guillardia theta CCMP2712]|eukprot:XP_005831948.1 hypothetical protein GUITHDRAFT_139257 [Guillardia theta CCMP2712]